MTMNVVTTADGYLGPDGDGAHLNVVEASGGLEDVDEVSILKTLKHPNVTQLFEVIENDKTLYLFMEYARGEELFEYIVDQGPLGEQEAKAKFRQILSALYDCHKKGIAHWDLKTENLLLDANRNGKKYDGPMINVWSLGVILYTMVSRDLPSDSDNFHDLRDQIIVSDLWVNLGYEEELMPYVEPFPDYEDAQCTALLSMGYTNDEIRESLSKQHDNIMGTYLLLGSQKQEDSAIPLQPQPSPVQKHSGSPSPHHKEQHGVSAKPMQQIQRAHNPSLRFLREKRTGVHAVQVQEEGLEHSQHSCQPPSRPGWGEAHHCLLHTQPLPQNQSTL
ncbi:serine/threonine-protein kinase MARK2-like [Choloepus didactylus]|uniref:serine/threonine-protein kinase MARK2-like n=1 Tax=Choloepus didactylus TaxID=27675 RepID=UPI0018A00CAA|nr:serine/threonine-protein kinase MARK2-like [Choloepus didactylus]